MIFSTESEDREAPVFFNARNHYSFFSSLNFALCALMVCLIFSAMVEEGGFRFLHVLQKESNGLKPCFKFISITPNFDIRIQ